MSLLMKRNCLFLIMTWKWPQWLLPSKKHETISQALPISKQKAFNYVMTWDQISLWSVKTLGVFVSGCVNTWDKIVRAFDLLDLSNEGNTIRKAIWESRVIKCLHFVLLDEAFSVLNPPLNTLVQSLILTIKDVGTLLIRYFTYLWVAISDDKKSNHKGLF